MKCKGACLLAHELCSHNSLNGQIGHTLTFLACYAILSWNSRERRWQRTPNNASNNPHKKIKNT